MFTSFASEFMAASLLGLTIYVLWPVAPPWMTLPIRRVSNILDSFYRVFTGGVHADPNPFAAMPSLHVAIAVLTGYYIYALGGELFKALGVAWPVLMAWDVVYTGNHYLLDIVMGIAVALVTMIALKKPALKLYTGFVNLLEKALALNSKAYTKDIL